MAPNIFQQIGNTVGQFFAPPPAPPKQVTTAVSKKKPPAPPRRATPPSAPVRTQAAPPPRAGSTPPPAAPRQVSSAMQSGPRPSYAPPPAPMPQQNASVPPPPPVPAPRLWMPLVDPNRTQGNGQGMRVPQFIRNAFPGMDGEIDPGDWLPNIQQAIQPFKDPFEQGGTDAEDADLKRAAAERIVGTEALEAAEQGRLGEGLAKMAGYAITHPFAALSGATEYAQRRFPEQAEAIEGIADLSQTAVNLGNVASGLTEQAIGTAAQGMGVSPKTLLEYMSANPATLPSKVAGDVGYAALEALKQAGGLPTNADLGAEVSGFMRQVAASAIRNAAAGADDPKVREFLESQASAIAAPSIPASVQAGGFAEAVASAAAAMDQAGMGNGALLKVLEAIAPQHKDALMANAQALMADRGFTPEKFYASQYAYESTERLLEARERLQAGESWENVTADIEDKITFRERMDDLGYQMFFDPLNPLDEIKIFGVGGGITERIGKWMNADVARLVLQSPDGNGLKVLDEFGDITAPTRLERLPGVGDFFRRTPETRAARVAHEASAWVGQVLTEISEEAPARLAKLGVKAHPAEVVMNLIMNPSTDNLMGTGLPAQKIAEELGLGARALSPEEAKMFRIAEGGTYDLLRSDAADRARHLLGAMGDKSRSNLGESFATVQRLYKEAGEMGKVGVPLPRTQASKAMDAFDAADEAMIKWLERMDNAFKDATGYKPPTGLLRTAKAVIDPIQGVFARLFHMGFSPGFAIRNQLNNTVTIMLDGIDALTPISDVRTEMGRLDLISPTYARQAGGVQGLDMTPTALKPVTDFIDRFSSTRYAREFERRAGQRAILEGFNRVMRENWKIGRAIPAGSWDDLAKSLGDLAPKVQGLVEQARTKQDLANIRKALTSNEAWRVLDNPELAAKLDEAGIYADVQRIKENARTAQEAFTEINKLTVKMNETVDDVAKRLPPASGTPEAAILDEFRDVFKGMGTQGQEVYDEFIQRQAEFKVAMARADAYVGEALDALDSAAARPLEKEYRTLVRTANEAYGRIWEDRARILTWIRDDQLDQLAQTYPMFRGITDVSGAWNRYYAWIEETWEKARIDEIDRLLDLGKRAGGSTPPDVMAKIKLITPATTVQQQNYYAMIMNKADEAGMHIQHVRNLLRKNDLIPADHLFTPGVITNKEWVNRAVALINESAAKKVAQQAVNETIATLKPTKQAAAQIRATENVLRETKAHLAELQSTLFNNPNDRGLIAEIERVAQDVKDYQDELRGLTGQDWTAAINVDEMLEAPIPRVDRITTADQVGRMAAETTTREKLLAGVAEDILNRADDVAPALAREQLAALDKFIREVEPRMTAARTVAKNVGTHMRDFALHDYSDRRGFDLVMGMLYNYPYWYSRTAGKMMMRAIDTPGRLAALLKLRAALRRENRNLPEWWQDQLSLNVMGQQVYLPILASLDPLNGFLGDNFTDPDLNNTHFGAFLAEAQRHGPGLHAVWSMTMAADAWRRGETEEQLGWMSWLGQPTRGLNAVSVIAKAHGADFVPAGGIALEPWLGRVQNGEYRAIGSKYDAQRIGLSLAEMVQLSEAGDPRGYVNGKPVTKEMMYEALESQEGEIFDAALQRSRENTALSVVASWLFGAGIKPRAEIEITVQEMDAKVRNLIANKEKMSPEAYRQAWADMREEYPFMDAVRAFRRDDTEKQEIYAWSVYNRLPPNPNAYFVAMGADSKEAKIYEALLDKFYTDGLEGMTELEREDFMNVMKTAGAILAMPEDTTADEWEMARASRRGMYERLDREFRNASALEDEYFRLMDTQGREAAMAFLEKNGELGAYWDRKNELITKDPLLEQYYASMDTYERIAKDNFEAQQERLSPGLHATLDAYYAAKDRSEDDGKAFFAAHPEIAAYYKARDRWTVQLDEQLMEMSETVRNLEPKWAQLRVDAEFTHPGQRTVADLIESGSRPMGDFVLPEDLPAQQLSAQIGVTMDELEAAGWNRSQIYKALKKMGDLDDVLNAFYEFRNTDTVIANDTKMRALLVALSSLSEGTTSPPSGGGGSGYRTGGGSVRTGSSAPSQGTSVIRPRSDPSVDPVTRSQQNPRPRRERVQSQRYGGASSAPQTVAQENQEVLQFNEIIGTVQSSAPMVYGLMRNLADISSEQEFAAFLADPAHKRLHDYLFIDMKNTLKQANPNLTDEQFRGWLTRLIKHIKTIGSRGTQRSARQRNRGNQSWFTRVSNPLL